MLLQMTRIFPFLFLIATLPALARDYEVVATYPHARDAFTQGLEYRDGFLYEGTGRNGRSELRRIRLETGEVLQRTPLDARHFGEGITVWRDRIIQLTWQSETGFVYDRKTFGLIDEFSYSGEGWGLTNDGTRLIMSDGSDILRFLDPQTFKEISRLTVRDHGVPVVRLNELEFVRGEILANVWQTNRIARISPKTGEVLGWIDLKGILPPEDARGVDVLNGIAYDAKRDRLFVTGKLWPKIFEIRIKRAKRAAARHAGIDRRSAARTEAHRASRGRLPSRASR